jgi:FkbM family methyltransferase
MLNLSLFRYDASDIIRKLGKFCRLLPRCVWRRGLLHGVAAAVEHTVALKDLALKTVVDVGANKGQFSLLIRGLFPDAQIFAFEPIPEAANKACHLFRNDPMFLLPAAPNRAGLALGESSGRSILHLSRRADSSSLLPITALQSRLFPRTEEVGTIEIEVARLSEVIDSASIKPPSLLKIDVQGSELSVLKGAGAVLTRFDYVYVECSRRTLYEGQALEDDVASYLTAHGFTFVDRFGEQVDEDGELLQSDCLWSRKEEL